MSKFSPRIVDDLIEGQPEAQWQHWPAALQELLITRAL